MYSYLLNPCSLSWCTVSYRILAAYPDVQFPIESLQPILMYSFLRNHCSLSWCTVPYWILAAYPDVQFPQESLQPILMYSSLLNPWCLSTCTVPCLIRAAYPHVQFPIESFSLSSCTVPYWILAAYPHVQFVARQTGRIELVWCYNMTTSSDLRVRLTIVFCCLPWAARLNTYFCLPRKAIFNFTSSSFYKKAKSMKQPQRSQHDTKYFRILMFCSFEQTVIEGSKPHLAS